MRYFICVGISFLLLTSLLLMLLRMLRCCGVIFSAPGSKRPYSVVERGGGLGDEISL